MNLSFDYKALELWWAQLNPEEHIRVSQSIVEQFTKRYLKSIVAIPELEKHKKELVTQLGAIHKECLNKILSEFVDGDSWTRSGIVASLTKKIEQKVLKNCYEIIDGTIEQSVTSYLAQQNISNEIDTILGKKIEELFSSEYKAIVRAKILEEIKARL